MSYRFSAPPSRTLDEIREDDLEPHARLMLAVLEEAFMTLQVGLDSRCPKARRLSREASEWIRSRDCDPLFSFENVCSVLGVDADYLRAGIQRMKQTAVRSAVPVPVTRVRRAYAGLETRPVRSTRRAA